MKIPIDLAIIAGRKSYEEVDLQIKEQDRLLEFTKYNPIFCLDFGKASFEHLKELNGSTN